jgi:pimeloyl-ACP methyl ester carboxylesterase
MYRGDLAIIAVRGTAKASEWLTNLNAERLGTTAPQYHPGFLMEAWDGMVELKTKLAAALVRPNLYFTGHSLGGAIAAILAPRMCERTAYVFGSPRFGNAQAVERAEPYAYVRPNDLVPHLPWDRLGYANAASRLDVVGDGDPVQASAFKSLKDWLVPGGRPFAVQHDIKGYRHHLAQAANVRSPELAFLELRQAYARPLKV